jgi:hypothetical protein
MRPTQSPAWFPIDERNRCEVNVLDDVSFHVCEARASFGERASMRPRIALSRRLPANRLRYLAVRKWPQSAVLSSGWCADAWPGE